MLRRRKARVEFAFFVMLFTRLFHKRFLEVFGVVDDLKLLAVDIIIVSLSYQIRSFLLVKVE